MNFQEKTIRSISHININQHIDRVRLYTCDGNDVHEHCHDGKKWVVGALESGGEHVSATNSTLDHVHVFCTSNGEVCEWIYDKKGGWDFGKLEREAPLRGYMVARSTAAVSWHKSLHDQHHIRLFTCDGVTVRERCCDGGRWSFGALSQQAEMVTAAQFHEGHLRVYCTNGDSTTEWCYDGNKGWYKGDAKLTSLTQAIGRPVATSATAWTEGPSRSPRLRLYVSDGVDIHEFCFDSRGWTKGGFTTKGQQVSATFAGTLQLLCTTDGEIRRWEYDREHERWNQGESCVC